MVCHLKEGKQSTMEYPQGPVWLCNNECLLMFMRSIVPVSIVLAQASSPSYP